MSDGERRPTWLDRLLVQPAGYDPFVVLGLLEQVHRPSSKRIGGDGPAIDEGLRIRHSRALTFRPGAIERVELGDPIELTLSVLGLSGAESPLPTYLASEAAAADDDGQAKAEFFDLFHHRLHSLLYRAVRKFDWPSEFCHVGNDPWSARVLALLGLDTYDHTPLRFIRPLELLRVAPLLAGAARTAQTVELALAELLGPMLDGATVTLAQFRGSWVAIDADHQIRLGTRNSRLGLDALVGDLCLHRAGKAQVVIGPLDQAGLRRFSADGDGFHVVRELLELLSFELVEFELELVLASEARAAAILGVSRLSDDAWLASSEHGSDTRPQTRVHVSLAQEGP